MTRVELYEQVEHASEALHALENFLGETLPEARAETHQLRVQLGQMGRRALDALSPEDPK